MRECSKDYFISHIYLWSFSVSKRRRFINKSTRNSVLITFCFLITDDDEDCPECEEILEALEQIDGEVDQYGIDFVKIASVEAAAKHSVVNIPSLVYFRKRVPMLYDGDLHHVDKVLQWLTSQDVFEIKNEIEEVNRKMLDKLLEENEFLAVYFCKCFKHLKMTFTSF